MTIAIVLDLDDTLYLEETYVRSGIAWISNWLERETGLKGFQAEAEALREIGVRDHLFDRTLAHLGIAPDPAFVSILVAKYRSHPPSISLAADAEAFLTADHGFALALITDGHAVAQRAKIAALGLDRFAIHPIVCTDEWGRSYWKPHRRAFEVIEACLRSECDAFVYVADNPAKDFLAPRKLGWRTVQIDRAGAVHPRLHPIASHHADTRIRSFDELTWSLVERLPCRARMVG
ncbi:MAG: HAD family hydrolase [Sphingomonas sp.]